jgi:hypothetical protein
MEFRTRPISQVLDDLVAKLEQISPKHPDRPRLIRMIIDPQARDRAPTRTATRRRLLSYRSCANEHLCGHALAHAFNGLWQG